MNKVNSKGEYTPFHGWTVISNLNCTLGFIERNLRTSVLSKYFAPLPATSYHMTLYNIWCEGRTLLPQQNDDPTSIYPLLEQMQAEIDRQVWKPFSLQHAQILYTGSTLCIMIYTSDNFTQANNIRERMIKLVGIKDGMGCYHITLAYQYARILEANNAVLTAEVNRLNDLLNGQLYELEKPFVAQFQDMTVFQPCFDRDPRCI